MASEISIVTIQDPKDVGPVAPGFVSADGSGNYFVYPEGEDGSKIILLFEERGAGAVTAEFLTQQPCNYETDHLGAGDADANVSIGLNKKIGVYGVNASRFKNANGRCSWTYTGFTTQLYVTVLRYIPQ